MQIVLPFREKTMEQKKRERECKKRAKREEKERRRLERKQQRQDPAEIAESESILQHTAQEAEGDQ